MFKCILKCVIISQDAVWGCIGFGLAAPHLPQTSCERDNSKNIFAVL